MLENLDDSYISGLSVGLRMRLGRGSVVIFAGGVARARLGRRLGAAATEDASTGGVASVLLLLAMTFTIASLTKWYSA